VNLRPLVLLLFLSGCATEPPPLAPDPFFADQPGALSADELQAARAAMKAARGAQPELPLFASGRRATYPFMPAYAVFAGPAERLAGGALAYRRLGCNFYANDKTWRCGSHAFFQIEAGGAWQAFRYSGMEPLQPSQAAVDRVMHVYSRCFEDQYRALVGAARPAIAIRIHEALQLQGGFAVVTAPAGSGDLYTIQKADGAPGGCAFTLREAMVAGKKHAR
jgi:hypothetical protein